MTRMGQGTGLVFVGSVLAYVIARQALLRLRAETRTFSWRRSSRGSPA
jgi:hypothetical protein